MSQRQRTDINMYQGDTRSYKFTMYTDTAQTLEWDFSTATAVKMAVRSSLDQSAELFSATATNGQNGNDWANGIAIFEILGSQSILLGKNGVYDVQVTMPGSPAKPITPVYGEVILRRQVAT